MSRYNGRFSDQPVHDPVGGYVVFQETTHAIHSGEAFGFDATGTPTDAAPLYFSS